jgi:hypothetical protein
MPTHGERDASEQLYREIREKEKRRIEKEWLITRNGG